MQDFDTERDRQGRPLGRNMGNRDNDMARSNMGGMTRMRDSERGGMGGLGGGMGGLGGGMGGLGGGMAGGGGGGGGQGLKWGNTYGLSPQFLESLHITSPLVTRVFVANVSTVYSLFS